MLSYKSIKVLTFLTMVFSMIKETQSADIINEREKHIGFHSFYSPSIIVVSPQAPQERSPKSVIIKVDEFSDNDLDNELNNMVVPTYSLDLSCREDLTYDRLRKLAQNPLIIGLDVAETYLDNHGLKIISKLPLQFLDVSNNRFDDEGMEFMAFFSHLKELKMKANKVTAEGIKKVTGLNIKILDASCTYLGNDGIKNLISCKSLEELEVRACGLDDKSLNYFLEMSSLRFLDISANKSISREGILDFMAKKRESLLIKYDQF